MALPSHLLHHLLYLLSLSLSIISFRPFLSQAYPTTPTTPLDITYPSNGTTTATSSILDDGPKPQCHELTPGKSYPHFHCHAAVSQFLSTLVPGTQYDLSRWKTYVFAHYILVPYSTIAGSCVLKIDLKKALPVISLHEREFRDLLRQLVSTCVADERSSAGGELRVPFKGTTGTGNELVLDLRPVMFGDGDGDREVMEMVN